MTEAEWLACDDPAPMLEILSGKASVRKLQLFASGCARSIWTTLRPNDRERIQEVEAAADCVQGMPRSRSTRIARHSGNPLSAVRLPDLVNTQNLFQKAAQTAAACAGVFVSYSLNPNARPMGSTRQAKERGVQADLMRCIFGNPFRPALPDPKWLTSTVTSLAAGIYAERAFENLPILADALTDAGCENRDLLAHCRGEGPHVRGCWVVDLILGKS